MTKLLELVLSSVNAFDNSSEKVNEDDIYSALHKLEIENIEKDAHSEFVFRAETMAFGFCEDYPSDKGWGTYYGPMFILKNKEGQWVEGPSIQLVTSEILEYWTVRSNSANSPLLSMRYADLVWDFSEKIVGKTADYRIAQKVVDATIELINQKSYKHEIDAIRKIKRALHLALSMNDTERISSIKYTMLNLEDEIAQDNLAGLWGFCFDELLDNKYIPLSSGEKQKIITDMEVRLTRTASETVLDAHAAEIATTRLASYYRKWNNPDEYKRVLRTYGQVVIKTIEKVEPLAGSMWVEQLYALYFEYGMREDADRLTSLIRKLGEKASENMKTFSHEFSVTKDEMDDFTGALTEGSLYDALTRIAVHYVPNPEEIKKQVVDLSSETPFHSLISINITDWEGRPVAKIGSVEDDLDGRIIHQTSQNMSFSSVFLRVTLDKLFSKFNPSLEEVLNYIFQSPLFVEGNREIVSVGIKAYISGEHITSAHVLIPQIEHAVRHLFKSMGAPIYKPGRNGALFLRTLDELLRDENITHVFGERGASYLRILLTDQRGWNLRNDICHSTINPERFSWEMTDRIFHVILLLSLIREKSDEGKE